LCPSIAVAHTFCFQFRYTEFGLETQHWWNCEEVFPETFNSVIRNLVLRQ